MSHDQPRKSKDVFISYSRADTAFATTLYQRLKARDFTLWRDRSEMEAGKDWWPQIQEAIRESGTMVLCMSPKALASPVVTQEWRYARQVGTRVIPVLAGGCRVQKCAGLDGPQGLARFP